MSGRVRRTFEELCAKRPRTRIWYSTELRPPDSCARSASHCSVTKGEQLCRSFTQLVLLHYGKIRNVSWYAEKLGITHAYLCSTVKQVMGRTCGDIISDMVIMDAKSQLKSTHLSIQDISDSLHFANMSFFGKYFKRYVGMSPLEYRNKG